MRRPQAPRLAFLLLGLLLATALSASVGFLQNPVIDGGGALYTSDNLVCSWSASADTTNVTVAWLQDDSVFRNDTYNGSLPTNSTVGAGNTTRDEAWICRVTLSNGTDSAAAEANVTIENTAPLTPKIYNASDYLILQKYNITEDQGFTLDMNSSDADSDLLTYYFLDGKFCTVTASSTGAISCLPTHDYLNTNATGAENASQVSIEFWVRDQPPNTKSSSRSITFNITPVNDPPNATFSNSSVQVNATFNTTFPITDEEGDFPVNATLDAALTSVNISDDLAVSVENGNELRVYYGPTPVEYGDVGNHTVTVNLTDARGVSALVSFILEITSVNRPPYFTNITPESYGTSQPHTYVLDQGDNILINLSANDPDTVSITELITFGDNTTMLTVVTANGTAVNGTDAKGYIDYTAQNGDVGEHLVTITVADTQGLENSTVFNFTIVNVNDPPIIYNQSYDPANTAGNVNITPLYAYIDTPFLYQVNYTDPDIALGLDIVTWSDNTSTFNITSTGLINFTPTGAPRNETINVTVTDLAGAYDTRSIVLVLTNNAKPFYNQTVPNLACTESKECTFDLSYYAKDNDSGDYVAAYAAVFLNGSLPSFSINATSGLIDFIPEQTELGNYTVNLTIADTRGATAGQTVNLVVNNTESYPSWLQYDFSGATIVEGKEFNYQVIVTDGDLFLGGRNITFTTNESWATITYEYTANETVYGLLSFLPNSSQVGTESLMMNATDETGRTNSTSVTFTVLGQTDPPAINYIRPYGGANDTLTEAYLDVTGPGKNEENITIYENTTGVLFAINATDDVTPPASLRYYWYYDGALVHSGTGSAGRTYTKDFGFYSNGTHTMFVSVNDTTLEYSTWAWNLDVVDVNRPPYLVENYSLNITVSAVTTLPDFFLRYNGDHFFDPDDDLDGNGSIDGSEVLRLTFGATPCNFATFEYIGDDLRITPTGVGTCQVRFNGTDSGGLSATSNLVTIDVTEVPQGQSTTTTSSGGGGVTTQSTLIPFEQDVQTPHPLSIIAPQLVTIFENQTVHVPIELSNNWTGPLQGIVLSAKANASNIQMHFSTNYIEELPTNGSKTVELVVNGYRLGDNFEVKVTANVSNPSFQDSAIILFNSIEQADKGKDVQVKVTFARDLLSQHQECQELNELLQEADKQYKQGNYVGASQTIDVVINGCKFLISKTQQVQRPGFLRTPWVNLDQGTVMIVSFIALGVIIVLAVLGLLYYHHRTKEEYNF